MEENNMSKTDNNEIDILKTLSVINRDNGSEFTDTARLDVIASLLGSTGYRKINDEGLFHLYSLKPAEELQDQKVIIVSSHVDCEYHITKCFTKEVDENTLLGTFDNSATNAAILHLMLEGRLPSNVIVAFTGDEEETGRGAKDVIRFIRRYALDVVNVFVLDVTAEGWVPNADFTVENDLWDDVFGAKVIELVKASGYKWNYVPADACDIPDYIPMENRIIIEAYEDESWEYDEADIPCFSFCLPTKGEMHSDEGILARIISFKRYTEMLGKMLKLLS